MNQTPRRVTTGCVAALCVAAVLQGCGDGGEAGVDGAVGDAWTIGPPSVVVADGPGTDFFNVSGVVRLSDGRLVVADGGSSEVRYFAADGTYLFSAGRRGEGPGEFSLIQAAGPAGGDSVWVYDYGTQRITILAQDGAVVRTTQVTPPLSAGMMVGRRSDGTFVMSQMWGSGDPTAPMSEGLAREPVVAVAYDPSGRILDTLASVPGREVLHRLEGSRMTMGAVPFAHNASQVLLGDDLVVGDQVGYSVALYGYAGDSPVEWSWSGPSLELRDGDVERWREEQVAMAPEGERAGLRSYLAEAPHPASRPAYGRLLADAAGYLWIAQYADPSHDAPRWDVLDASGRWVGVVDVPDRFRPIQVGSDWILGVARDELGVERIELHLLHRGSPSRN